MLPIKALIDERVAEGRGSDSFSSIVEAIKRPAVAR